MGQHKTNPTAIAFKNGEIEPRKKKLGKKQNEAVLKAMLWKATTQNLSTTFPSLEKYFD